MSLKIDISTGERVAPEHGWGVAGEVLGRAETEELLEVVDLGHKSIAERLVEDLQQINFAGKCWFLIPVTRIDEGGKLEAHYIEASNLTHPG